MTKHALRVERQVSIGKTRCRQINLWESIQYSVHNLTRISDK